MRIRFQDLLLTLVTALALACGYATDRARASNVYNTVFATPSAVNCSSDSLCALLKNITVQSVTIGPLTGAFNYAWNGTCPGTGTTSGPVYIAPTGTSTGCFVETGPTNGYVQHVATIADMQALDALAGSTVSTVVVDDPLQGGTFNLVACGGSNQPSCTADNGTTFAGGTGSPSGYIWQRNYSGNLQENWFTGSDLGARVNAAFTSCGGSQCTVAIPNWDAFSTFTTPIIVPHSSWLACSGGCFLDYSNNTNNTIAIDALQNGSHTWDELGGIKGITVGYTGTGTGVIGMRAGDSDGFQIDAGANGFAVGLRLENYTSYTEHDVINFIASQDGEGVDAYDGCFQSGHGSSCANSFARNKIHLYCSMPYSGTNSCLNIEAPGNSGGTGSGAFLYQADLWINANVNSVGSSVVTMDSTSGLLPQSMTVGGENDSGGSAYCMNLTGTDFQYYGAPGYPMLGTSQCDTLPNNGTVFGTLGSSFIDAGNAQIDAAPGHGPGTLISTSAWTNIELAGAADLDLVYQNGACQSSVILYVSAFASTVTQLGSANISTCAYEYSVAYQVAGGYLQAKATTNPINIDVARLTAISGQ